METKHWGGPLASPSATSSDFNTDWAQQLKTVESYVDETPHHQLLVRLLPMVEPSSLNRLRNPPAGTLPPPVTLREELDLPIRVPPNHRDGTVFISDSKSTPEDVEFGDGVLNPDDAASAHQPDTTIQHGVYVYNGKFPVPLASALVEAHEA